MENKISLFRGLKPTAGNIEPLTRFWCGRGLPRRRAAPCVRDSKRNYAPVGRYVTAFHFLRSLKLCELRELAREVSSGGLRTLARAESFQYLFLSPLRWRSKRKSVFDDILFGFVPCSVGWNPISINLRKNRVKIFLLYRLEKILFCLFYF